jgi:GNAT superfamily N-acetyltransferase
MATTDEGAPREMKAVDPAVSVRQARPEDAGAILRLVRGLADYEKLPPPDPAAEERLVREMFSTAPRIQAFLGEWNGEPAGYAFVFETYSSFLALPTLYLEDIFVLPEYRSRKIGYALFRAMVREAHSRGCGRMEWTVLDWNALAIDFYRGLGAREMSEWKLYRLGRPEMERILTL